jgi:hypothetical protein
MFYLNDEEITVNELLKQIGQENLLTPFKELKAQGKNHLAVFRLKHTKIDPSGSLLYSPQKFSNEIYINIEGYGEARLTVSNRPPQRKKDELVYENIGYSIDEPVEVIDPLKDTQKFVYFMLYPSNESSPFKKNPKFFLQDKEKESKTNLAIYKLKKSVEDHILSLDLENQRILLAGLGVVGATKMDENEVVLRLYQQIETDVKKVAEAKDSSVAVFNGTVQLAIEKRVLFQDNKNGVTRWYIDGSQESLCVVPSGTEAIAYIKSWYANNVESYRYLTEKLTGNTEENKIDTVVKESKKSPLQSKYDELVDAGIIYLDATNKSVKFVVGEEHHVLVTLESTKGWKDLGFEAVKSNKENKKQIEKLHDDLVAVQ